MLHLHVVLAPRLYLLTSPPPLCAAGYGGGHLKERDDYQQLLPCCGTTKYWAASGYAVGGIAGR